MALWTLMTIFHYNSPDNLNLFLSLYLSSGVMGLSHSWMRLSPGLSQLYLSKVSLSPKGTSGLKMLWQYILHLSLFNSFPNINKASKALFMGDYGQAKKKKKKWIFSLILWLQYIKWFHSLDAGVKLNFCANVWCYDDIQKYIHLC